MELQGKEIGFERNRLISSTPARLRTWYGRELVLDGVPDDAMSGDSVSLRGTYRAGTLEVERFHAHGPHLHRTPSLIALALLVLAICQAQLQALRGSSVDIKLQPLPLRQGRHGNGRRYS